MQNRVMTEDAIRDLAWRALRAAGAAEWSAMPLARAIAAEEAAGLKIVGLAYLPTYCRHLETGRVDGQAVPVVERPADAVVAVDAAHGFAHPAIEAGFGELIPLAQRIGAAVMPVRRSYNAAGLGMHTRWLAEEGLFAIGVSNAPASLFAPGGRRRVLGTNPVSIAAPDGAGGAAVLIDQATSAVTYSAVRNAAAAGMQVPEGWGVDADGQPTTDPARILAGSLSLSGGHKGFGIGLMVEMMAACLAAGTPGTEMTGFGAGDKGGPPGAGQFFIAINPGATSGGAYAARIAGLIEVLRSDPAVHVPGDTGRAARAQAAEDGIEVSGAVLAEISCWAGPSP